MRQIFEGKEPKEKVIFVLKKHPAVLFRPLFYLTLFTFLPIAAFVFFKYKWPFFYTLFLWLGLSSIYGLKSWYCFIKTRYILTSERLICFKQKGFFVKDIQEIPLSKVQDVGAKISGFWSSVFDFGDIYVKTLGGADALVLQQVEEPRKIQEEIFNQIKKEEEKEIRKKKKEENRRAEDSQEEEFWD